MKKTIVLLLALCMLLLVGCSSEAEKQEPPAEETPQDSGEFALPESYDLVLGMGGPSSSSYALGIQIGEYFKEAAPGIRVTVKDASGSISGQELTQRNEFQITQSQGDLVYLGLNGKEPFSAAQDNIYGVANIMKNAFHLAVAADAPVNSIKDIVEQKYPLEISAGNKGSGIELMFRTILKAYGATYEDIESWGGRVEFIGFADAVTMYKDGELNAVTIASGIPYSLMTDVTTARDMKLLALDQEIVDELCTIGYVKNVIPAGSYKGNDSDILTIGSPVNLVASGEADSAVIYEVTKFLNSEEGIRIAGDINASFKEFMTGPESGVTVQEAIELHPGAEKYYREAGVID